MAKCDICSRIKSPITPIYQFNGRDLCPHCFCAEYINSPMFGEKKEQCKIRCEAWLDGNQKGRRSGMKFWIFCGAIFTLAIVFGIEFIGWWLG